MATERNLIQRMAKELDTWLMAHHYGGVPPEIQHAATLVAEARAFLAQPEPEAPTDEELLAIAIESELVASNGTNPFREGSDIEDEVMQFARTVIAADRARWGRPVTTQEAS